jgi:hypothetical protein
MAKRLGKNTILSIYTAIKDAEGDAVAAAYFPIGCLTTNDINHTVNMTDGTKTKCDNNPEPSYDTVTYEVTFEAIEYDDDGAKVTYDDLLTLLDANVDNNDYIFFKITDVDGATVTRTRFGKGFLTALSESAPAEGETTFSGTITGAGRLSATDLNV